MKLGRAAHWLLLALIIGVLAACGVSVAERNNSGNQFYAHQEYEAALRAYQAAQVAAPDRPEAYFNAAAALVGSAELDDAVEALEQALKSADGEVAVKAYYNMGNVFYNLGLYADAIIAYQQALLIDPNDADARYNLEIALLRYVPPTPTAQEQQTEPDLGQTDPETTPTDEPGGFDGPTPTPPPQDFDLTATPDTGQGGNGREDSQTPIPQSQGTMTVEEAERLLEQIERDQESLREFLEEEAASGQPSERDW